MFVNYFLAIDMNVRQQPAERHHNLLGDRKRLVFSSKTERTCNAPSTPSRVVL
jgi:hypothetical protein